MPQTLALPQFVSAPIEDHLLDLVTVYAQSDALPQLRRNLGGEAAIYRTQGDTIAGGCVTSHTLAHSAELLTAPHMTAREVERLPGRWQDIDPGSGLAGIEDVRRARGDPRQVDAGEARADACLRPVALSMEDRCTVLILPNVYPSDRGRRPQTWLLEKIAHGVEPEATLSASHKRLAFVQATSDSRSDRDLVSELTDVRRMRNSAAAPPLFNVPGKGNGTTRPAPAVGRTGAIETRIASM